MYSRSMIGAIDITLCQKRPIRFRHPRHSQRSSYQQRLNFLVSQGEFSENLAPLRLAADKDKVTRNHGAMTVVTYKLAPETNTLPSKGFTRTSSTVANSRT